MNNRANNSDGRGELSSDSVTSHDLMMFADGELDAQREAAVASYLRENETGRAVVSTVWEMGARIRELQDRKAIDAGADGIASLVMARIEQEASAPRKENVVPLVTSERRAVGFGPVVVGGLALAAGVALLVWRLVGMDLTQPIPEKTAGALSSEKPVSVSALSTEDDPEPGVSVDSIDFGARTGTIFYVPNGAGSTTTVVWLTDDEVGGNP